MSEIGNTDTLNTLENVLQNPEVTRIHEEIAEYQQLLNEGSFSKEEKNQIIHALDDKWPYMNQRIVVTGNIARPTLDDLDDCDLEQGFIEDCPVESLGFTILGLKSVENPDEVMYKIGHLFVFEPQQIREEPMRKIFGVVHGFALPDDITVEYPFTSEVEKFDKLHYFYPDIAQEIDVAILNAPNESEAVMSLNGINIQIQQDDLNEELNGITDYINSRICFDQRMPYRLQFEGFCYAVSANFRGGLVPAHATRGTTLAFVRRIEALTEPVVDSTTDKPQININFGVRIELVNPDAESDTGTEYIIPITDSFDMRDIRAVVYSLITMSDKS